MLDATLLEQFDTFHDRAKAIIAKVEPGLRAGGQPCPMELARARWELMRTLTEFQIFKHRAIFDPVIRWGPPLQARQARELKVACTRLGDDFRAHVVRWTQQGSSQHWPEYREAALAMIARVAEAMDGQRRQIEALLATPGVCQGRSAPDRAPWRASPC